MPIPYFNLHDRTAEQLADELIRQIPAHTPEWRNPRPGDPGRTLIDLFAWMGDKLLYRVNLLPERQRLMFLRLLDMPPRPAEAARGLISLTHSVPADRGRVDLAARTLVPGPVEFETLDDATILPVSGAVYVKRLPDAVESQSVASVKASLESVYDLQSDGSTPYVTTPLFCMDRADPAGIDIATETVDQCLWFALLAAEPVTDRKAFVQAAFSRGAGPVLANIGFAPRETVLTQDQGLDAPVVRPEEWMWQMPSNRQHPGGAPRYNTLPPAVSDTTDGYARPGVLRLILPDAGEIGLPQNDPDEDVLAGVGDRPPRVDDPETAARLIGWLRLVPKTRVQTLALSWAGVNAAEVEHRRTLSNLIVGTAKGGSDQQVALPAGSVDADSLVMQVQREDGLFETWSPTDELLSHGREDRVFALDPEAGIVRFGDGVRGALPPRGAKIKVARMRHGGGTAGNLTAGSLDAIAHPRLKATQPVATTGGAEAETLDEVERRLPARLRHGDRAVTESDFQDLAALTPGVDLARVEVMPRFRPYQRLSDVPGTVSVLIVPQGKSLEAPHPRPDRTMLAAVQGYLDARRLMGTELHVIGPEYRQIAASASVRVREGHAPDRVLADVESALRTYLTPLAPGGREANGWALGQTVGNLELEVVIARVTGVSAVFGVNLFVRGDDGERWDPCTPEPGSKQTIPLESWMLPELAAVVLDQNPAGPASSVDDAGVRDPSGTGALGTPIPVVPELC